MQTTRILITSNKAYNIIVRALECVSGESSIEKDIAYIVATDDQYDDFIHTCVHRGVTFHVEPITGADIIAK